MTTRTTENPAFPQLERDSRGFMPACVLAAFAELDLGALLLTGGNSLSAADMGAVVTARNPAA